MEIDTFLLGLIAVGLGLTVKVMRDGMRDIGDVQVLIADAVHATAETEANTLDLEEKARARAEEVNQLKKHVRELEDTDRDLSAKIRARKKADKDRSQTKFKVDLG